MAHLRLHIRGVEGTNNEQLPGDVRTLKYSLDLRIHYFFVQAVLLLSTLPPVAVGEALDVMRLYDAVNVILSLQVIGC